MRLGGHTVTVIRPPGLDRFGDPLPGSATETDVPGCFVQPRSTSGQSATTGERTDLRDQVITDLVAFLPSGVDVTALDQVRFAGDLYQVQGDPARWSDLHGAEHHLEVPLRRIRG